MEMDRDKDMEIWRARWRKPVLVPRDPGPEFIPVKYACKLRPALCGACRMECLYDVVLETDYGGPPVGAA